MFESHYQLQKESPGNACVPSTPGAFSCTSGYDAEGEAPSATAEGGATSPEGGDKTPLQERAEDAIIEDRGNPYHDISNGRFTSGSGGGTGSEKTGFRKKTLVLPKKEYGHVMHEINSHYDAKYKGKKRGIIYLSGGKYSFEIHGFGDYNIYAKK